MVHRFTNGSTCSPSPPRASQIARHWPSAAPAPGTPVGIDKVG